MNRWTLRATGYGALAAALSIAGLSIAGQATQQSPSQSPSPGRTGPGSGQMGPGPHHGPHGQQGPHGQRVFDYFDRDKSGDVTRAEVQSVALEHFTRIDTNDDNLVSKAELMDHARQSRPGGPTGETLDARAERGLNIVFQLGDADDDGTISQVEMQTKVNQIFAVVDRNQDGVLERDEYQLSSSTEAGDSAPPSTTPPPQPQAPPQSTPQPGTPQPGTPQTPPGQPQTTPPPSSP